MNINAYAFLLISVTDSRDKTKVFRSDVSGLISLLLYQNIILQNLLDILYK